MLEISVVIDEEILENLHNRKEKLPSFIRHYLSETSQKATVFGKIWQKYEKDKAEELKDNPDAIPIFIAFMSGFVQDCNADQESETNDEGTTNLVKRNYATVKYLITDNPEKFKGGKIDNFSDNSIKDPVGFYFAIRSIDEGLVDSFETEWMNKLQKGKE